MRTSAAVCKRSRKPPQSGELDMHELRSGPTKVKGLRRRGRTDRHTHTHTHELKGSELYPLSERMRIYIADLAWPGWIGWLGWLGLARWGGGGRRQGGGTWKRRREDIQ